MPNREYQRLAVNEAEAEDAEVAGVAAYRKPEEVEAGFFSKCLFSWVSPMVKTGYLRALEMEDLLRLIPGDRAEPLASRWQEGWKRELEESNRWKNFIGRRVIDDDMNEGTLLWLGRLRYSANPDSFYAGVAWDNLRRRQLSGGKTIGGDGWFYGEKIFDCEEGHGSFIKPHLLRIKGQEHVKPPKTPWVTWGVKSVFGQELLIAGLYKLVNDIAQFGGPLALEAIVKFLKKDKDDAHWGEGLLVVGILFICQIIQSLCANQYFFLVFRVGMRVRQALSCAVFDKSLVLTEHARSNPDLNIGRIVNMMSTDVQRGQDVIQNLHQLWSAPLQIIVSCVLLYRLVGVSLFAGIGVMLCATPVQARIMRAMMRTREQMVKCTDERVKAVTEVLGGIRIVKFMAWVGRFQSVLEGIRNLEIDKLAIQQNLRVVMFVIIYLTPLLLTATTFIVYSITGGDVTAEVVFPSIALFSILRFPFIILPMQFNAMVNAKVSFDRLTQFLELPSSNEDGVQIEPLVQTFDDDGHQVAISATGTFHAYEPQVVEDIPPNLQQLAPGSNNQGNINTDQQEAHAVAAGDKKGGKPPKKQVKTKKYRMVPKVVLKDIDITIRKDKLTMIVGSTGSGKSCLLEALLGLLDSNDAHVRRMQREGAAATFCPENVAYAPQHPWIMNATFKENILFFSGCDEDRYQQVLDACQLLTDVEQLQSGDSTEIGEKGINLSGGQKQRVSIARSVYSNCKVVMLDDPLSAVDPYVGKELMRRVIGSSAAARPADWPEAELDGTTRVLVTHQIQYLKHADDIIFMKDGRVQAFFRGTDETSVIDQVLAYNGSGAEFFAPVHEAAAAGDFDDDLVKAAGGITPPPEKKPTSVTPSRNIRSKSPPAVRAAEGKLTTVEERAQGSVKVKMYLAYIRAAGGWGWFGVVLFLFVMNQVVQQSCDLWLTWWTDSNSSDSDSSSGGDALIGNNLSTNQHMYIYIGLIIAAGIISLVRGFTVYSRFQCASRTFHDQLVANVLRAPMAFFDTTPLGRLINRFSKDIDQVDVVLPPTIITFFQLSLSALITLVIIASSQPIMIALLIPATFLYVQLTRMFSRSNRETKRLDSISKSPIFQHFTETLYGMKTIHSYDVDTCFRDENRRRLNANTMTTYNNLAVNRWLAIRLEFLGNFICCGTAFMAVATHIALSGANDSSTGMLALGITYSMNLTGQLNFLVRQVADLEAQMNGVERIVEFTEEIDQEPTLQYEGEPPSAPFRGKQYLHAATDSMAIVRNIVDKKQGVVSVYVPTEDDTRQIRVGATDYSRSAVAAPEKNWPLTAEITFENVKFRYRPGLPLVLKGLGGPAGLTIHEKEKIGIVGRTGAGKSTLMLALFRFVEIAGGRITIGGRDIRTLKLNDLRQRLSMIPQDPVLFQGTVKSNLDPFDECTDSAIWERLEQVNLAERIKAHDGKLEGVVTEGGQNFSVGQRQLLCMARALLKKNSKILLMDEATASIDHATDMAIQVTVREQFKNYTVLTVAHRLQTIMDSTRILVLDAGVCAEFDSPAKLLQDSNGILHEMAQKSGDFDRLQAIAEGRLNIVDALEAVEREVRASAAIVLATAAATAAAVVSKKSADRR